MNEKKNCGRFCVQFNLHDPRHIQVIELLEQQGRRKAQFIVEAVLREGDVPTVPDMAQLRQQVESWVQQLLAQQVAATAEPQTATAVVSDDLRSAIQGAMAGLG